MSRSKPLVTRAMTVFASVGLAGASLASCSGSAQSGLARSWISPHSKVIAVELRISHEGTRLRGTLREVFLISKTDSVDSQSFAFTGTANSDKLILRFGSKLGRINARVVGRRMTFRLPGSAAAMVLVAGSPKTFDKERGRIQDSAHRLVLSGLVKTENSDLSNVTMLTTKLSSFGDNVLDSDVGLIEQDFQEAQQSYVTAQGNISGDGLFFLCVDASGASIDASNAQKGLATFDSDVSEGDQLSSELTGSVASLAALVSEIREDELTWIIFTGGTPSINEIEQDESAASSAQSQWLSQVGQYSGQASTFVEEASSDASAALSLQDEAAPNGC